MKNIVIYWSVQSIKVCLCLCVCVWANEVFSFIRGKIHWSIIIILMTSWILHIKYYVYAYNSHWFPISITHDKISLKKRIKIQFMQLWWYINIKWNCSNGCKLSKLEKYVFFSPSFFSSFLFICIFFFLLDIDQTLKTK